VISVKSHIVVAFGTRPEVIKLWPVILEIQKLKDIRLTVVNTGQHQSLTQEILRDLELTPNLSFELARSSSDLNELATKLMERWTDFYSKRDIDLLIVQGDTATAAISALAAFHSGVNVVHVEAGLRTHNRNHPFPEEIYRQLIARLAVFHFAPTEKARLNLLNEGIRESLIEVTGNTGIDALRLILLRRNHLSNLPDKPFVLVTCHRRESIGPMLQVLLDALAKFAEEASHFKIKFVMHANPAILNPIKNHLSGISNIELLENQTYSRFILLMKHAHFIVTDSGGVQEEAPYLGKKVLVYREATERLEAIASGNSKFLTADINAIFNSMIEASKDFNKIDESIDIFGDGFASQRIVSKALSLIETKLDQ